MSDNIEKFNNNEKRQLEKYKNALICINNTEHNFEIYLLIEQIKVKLIQLEK